MGLSLVNIDFHSLIIAKSRTKSTLSDGISGCYWNSSITISGFDPSRSGGPQVPAPLEVKTCIFPIWLSPYTNCRYILRANQLHGTNCPRCVCPDNCKETPAASPTAG